MTTLATPAATTPATAAHTVSTHTVSTHTARVTYDLTLPAAEGSPAPTLVLVHGTGSAGAALTWGQLAPRFAEHRAVVTPDLSGTDRTTDDGAPLTVEGLAAQVTAVIEDLEHGPAAGRGPVDLLGFSMGAPVVAAVAALRPDLVRRLILVAGWAHTEGDEYLRNLFTLWRTLGPLDAEAFGRSVSMTGFSRGFLNTIGRDQVEQLIPNLPPTPGTLRHVDLDTRIDIRALLPLVQAPTLVIGGTEDATVPVEQTRALHAAIPGSSYAELPAGHVLFFERPEEFRALVEDFVDAP
ncbi:hydrolase [Kitasatospora sp. MMS16-BH015]|uniref:alpha/beta fold hydrolase n=1 Tax=Kitasatospora sp. MMS16-BH015 TaxID=2018025 RepID=UPI000CA0D94D|nr:alpha/beta hydrolase [Kitasatospora sp. MMS16-BH015]AUG78345.1 hydrolase [Kitasatospora sp. MMS16-BH015]